ncbi:hypothetical protein SLE2022_192320 [Rubroshorea leprosula]
MRSDRVFHAPSDVDDEKSCSLESSIVGDLDLEVDMMEQAKLQSVEGEGDGAEAISEDDVVMPNAVNVNGAKVISRDDEVASYCVEPNCSTKMEVEIVRTGTEVVEESEDMGENLNGSRDSNSNASRLGEAKKVGVHLETPVNIAEQGDVGNASQMSKNVVVDSYDMSNQNNNIEVSGMGCGVGRDVGSLTTGIGLKMVIGPNHKAEIGLNGTSIADPMEQSMKNDRKSKLKNSESASCFWDDMESDSGNDLNWMKRSDMCGRRKSKRRAKSCASVYRKIGGLEGFLIQYKRKGQRKDSLKCSKQILFENNPEKLVADESINDSNIQNCNKSFK